MRVIHTCILRLFTDQDEPETLRGLLRSLPHGGEYTFKGDSALLELIHLLIQSPEKTPNTPQRAEDYKHD
jgi:hypothetical protein